MVVLNVIILNSILRVKIFILNEKMYKIDVGWVISTHEWMECCVCLEEMNPLDGVTFSVTHQCDTHVICISCYVHVDRCPLCRYTPYEVPDTDGSQMLLRLRNKKNTSLEKITYLKTILKKKRADMKNERM